MDPEKVKAAQKWRMPLETIKQIQQFLGFMSYYRAFVPRHATVAAPLSDMLRKGVEVRWTKEAEEAARTLVDAVVEAPLRVSWDECLLAPRHD